MTNVIEVSESKVQLKLRDLMDKLDSEVKALYSGNAARGSLRSGATFKQVMRLMGESYSNLGTFMEEQFAWALKESLRPDDTLLETLKRHADFYFTQLRRHAEPHLKHTAQLIGNPELFERYVPETDQTLSRKLRAVHLAIDSIYVQRRNRGIRATVNKVAGWMLKLLRAGNA